MAKTFTFFSNYLIDASTLSIPVAATTDGAVSSEVRNDSGTSYNSFRLQIDYSIFQPWPSTARLGAQVEARDSSGVFYPIHYQFSPVATSGNALTRILIMQPNMDTYNAGIDDIIFPVTEESARISRGQGSLPETAFRLRIKLWDPTPSGDPLSFERVTVNASGEMYNV